MEKITGPAGKFVIWGGHCENVRSFSVTSVPQYFIEVFWTYFVSNPVELFYICESSVPYWTILDSTALGGRDFLNIHTLFFFSFFQLCFEQFPSIRGNLTFSSIHYKVRKRALYVEVMSVCLSVTQDQCLYCWTDFFFFYFILLFFCLM